MYIRSLWLAFTTCLHFASTNASSTVVYRSTHLHAVSAAVDVVAEEEEAGGRQQGAQAPQRLLETHQVLEVAVDVACRDTSTGEVRARENRTREVRSRGQGWKKAGLN